MSMLAKWTGNGHEIELKQYENKEQGKGASFSIFLDGTFYVCKSDINYAKALFTGLINQYQDEEKLS